MNLAATVILNRVLAEMQEADEMGGPETDDYIELMEHIGTEALKRARNAREYAGSKTCEP